MRMERKEIKPQLQRREGPHSHIDPSKSSSAGLCFELKWSSFDLCWLLELTLLGKL